MRAVLASTRAPGVYPPIVLNGDLLVDGGIVNNVPVDVMKQFCKGGRVIAVDVSPVVDPTMTADYGFSVSGWGLLGNRLNPFSQRRARVLNMTSILMRAITFGDATRRGTELEAAADVYLKAPLETFKINDFKRGKEIAEATYAFALPRIRAWHGAVNQRSRA